MDVTLLKSPNEEEQRSILDVIQAQKDVRDDDIVMKIYYESMWEYSEEKMEDVISQIDNTFLQGYIVFDEMPISIGVYKRKGEMKVCLDKPYEVCPTYLSDIMNSSIYNSNIATDDEYSRVICFDGTNSLQGVVVYYINGENTIVYYYETYTSSPLEFTLQDFQVYGTAYYEFLTADENNYSGNGMFLGGTQTFAFFISQVDINDLKKEDSIGIEIYMLFGIIVVLVVLVVLYIKKRINE